MKRNANEIACIHFRYICEVYQEWMLLLLYMFIYFFCRSDKITWRHFHPHIYYGN